MFKAGAALLRGAQRLRAGTSTFRVLALTAAASSGCATLVYELAWLRWLTSAVGATFPAITVVLTSFMLGLGLGSLIGGWRADRTTRHLREYAILEVVVAIVCAGFPMIASAVGSLEIGDTGPFSGRALVAGLALLPATTLMGMTFPLLSSALHRGDEGARHVPLLYGANTVGAAGGAILGGLILPYTIGVAESLVVAFAFNVLAAFLAWNGSRAPHAPPTEAADDIAPVELPSRYHLLLVLSAGSGALIMLAELFWSRAILQLNRQQFATLLIEPSDAITLVLVLVLLGNGVGSLLATRLANATPARIARVVALTWGCAGVLCLAGLEWPAVITLGLADDDPGFWMPYAVYLRLLPVLPPAILFGLGFPLVMRLYAGALRGHGNRLSTVWLANTLGSVAGSIGGGWWLMPLLGSDRGLVGCAFLAVALAAVALAFAGLRGRDVLPLGGATVVVAVIALLVPLGPGQVFLEKYGPKAVIASWEGWEATTIVWQKDNTVIWQQDSRMLTSNGRSILARPNLANGGREALGWKPNAERVLLIGFGTGLFAKGLLTGEHIQKLTIAEIDGAQFSAAQHFGASDVLEDPRVEFVVNDALHFLSTTDREFDLIVVDAWGPDASPSLYSADFHRLAQTRLTSSGLVWSKVNALQADSLEPVLDAVRCTWDYAYDVELGEGNSALVGSKKEVGRHSRSRLLAADQSCDPLEILYPRRLRADFSAKLTSTPQADRPPPPN